nr:MAG TPA: hypothetical protein [Caudoviricetes sp.]
MSLDIQINLHGLLSIVMNMDLLYAIHMEKIVLLDIFMSLGTFVM